MNININNINNIINEIFKITKIQIERLIIEKIIDISNNNYNLQLEINKLYLFYFENNSNILYNLQNEWLNLNTNSLLIENKEYNIIIKTLNNEIENIKIYIINDNIDYKQKNFNIETLSSLNIKKLQNNQNNIFIIENTELLTNELCNKLINYIETTNDYQIEKWGERQNVNCKYVNIELIKNQEDKKNIDDEIYKIINYIIYVLYNEYDIKSTSDSGYCLRKIYGPTRLHIDGLSVTAIENRYIPIKKIRNMSIIIALNDDYEGGEFYFPRQNFKIKLKKGQIIAFPPYWTHPHMVYTPLNGTSRYTINTWLFE
jgi:hypothetical protein